LVSIAHACFSCALQSAIVLSAGMPFATVPRASLRSSRSCGGSESRLIEANQEFLAGV
jgi:hypothetical protein